MTQADQPPVPAAPVRRSGLRRFWRWATFALALALALKFVDFRAVGRALADLSPWVLLFLMAVVTVDRLTMAFKWRFIGASLGLRLPYLDCLKAYYTASLISSFMPTSLGGDLYRGFQLAPKAGGAGPVFVTIAMEKVVNAVASLFWAWIGLAYASRLVSAGVRAMLLVNLGLVTLLVFLVIAALMSEPLLQWTLGLMRRLGLKRDVTAVAAACAGFSRRKARLLQAIGLGVVENVGEYTMFFAAGLAIGVDVPPATFLAAIVLNHVVRKVVLYAESWSFAEAATVAAYNLAGIPPHQGLAISLVRHSLHMISVLPGFLFLLRHNRTAPQEKHP